MEVPINLPPPRNANGAEGQWCANLVACGGRHTLAIAVWKEDPKQLISCQILYILGKQCHMLKMKVNGYNRDSSWLQNSFTLSSLFYWGLENIAGFYIDDGLTEEIRSWLMAIIEEVGVGVGEEGEGRGGEDDGCRVRQQRVAMVPR
ncbi:hypothetical protein ACLOJK_023582 [Asimina triloba]